MEDRQLLRSVKLTDDQIITARVAYSFSEEVNNILVELISQLAERKTIEKRSLWDGMEKLGNVDKATECVSINWITGSLDIWAQDSKPDIL